MTDLHNASSSGQGLPEPPHRSPLNSQPAQMQVTGADTSGIDVPCETLHTSAYEPFASSERTESFSAARAGDTDAMPGINAQRPHQATSLPSAAMQQEAYGAPASGVPSYASRVASGEAAQSSTPVTSGAASYAQKEKSAPSAGKTFLFGFLGALAACALALGGFAFAGGLHANNAPAASSTLIGTTDQSVIEAVDEGQTLAEAVAAKALPSVVAIYNYMDQQPSTFGFGYGYGGTQGSDSNEPVKSGMGSGVVISSEGYILTNYHVVENAAKLTVSVNGEERDATYVGGDSSSDVAVVKVDNADGLVPADIGDSDSLRIGEWVMTVGAPLGLESSVATGVVSATNRSTIMNSSSDSSDLYSYFYGGSTPEYTYYPNMIQTDAVINPGNSGGALVDADGKLIGINTMISSYSGDYAGVGFAIPVNYAIQIAQNVIDGKEPTHAVIGVSLSQVNATIAQQYNLSADKGAYISAITPDSGAAASDLQVGDIIVKVDKTPITSPNDVTLEVRAHKVGDTIPIVVNREGEELTIDVTLGSDENMAKTQGEDEKQQQQAPEGQNMRDQDNGGRRGYSIEELEELLKMLGM